MAKKITETFDIKGMTCAGCEAAIQKKLGSLAGVYSVSVRFSDNTVTISYDPARVNLTKFRQTLKEADYGIERHNTVAMNKQTKNTEKHLSKLQFAGIAALVLAAYLIISKTVGFNFIPEVNASMGYGVLFVIGLLTSLHCVAMCGGINMSQCVGIGQGPGSTVRPSLMYNAGRVVSYTIIGGIIGAIGSVISFSGWARGIVAIASGIFMVIMGLGMTGLFPWLNKMTPRLPRFLREKAGAAGHGKGPFVVGLLNGLMPCGPLQAMQLYALGTGSLLAGALSMFFFSLGTLPLMFGLGALITMAGKKFTKNMLKVSAALVAVLGIVMLGRGLALSGIPLPFAGNGISAAAEQTAQQDDVKDGVQYITSTIESTRSYPAITVSEGVPVVWTLKADADMLNGCNNAIVIPAYNIQQRLKAGDNVIEFTPTKTGAQIYTCWMGMVYGQINVVDGDTKSAAGYEPEAYTATEVPNGVGSCCAAGYPTTGDTTAQVPTFDAGVLGSCCDTGTAFEDTQLPAGLGSCCGAGYPETDS